MYHSSFKNIIPGTYIVLIMSRTSAPFNIPLNFKINSFPLIIEIVDSGFIFARFYGCEIH